MAKYLDETGLSTLWAKIKSYFISAVSYDSSSHTISATKNGTASTVVDLDTFASISSGTITIGSATITPLTSHQSITGKADTSKAINKVSNTTLTQTTGTNTWSGTTTFTMADGTTTTTATISFDATKFINDGMIDSVTYVATKPSDYTGTETFPCLYFVWNTAAGKTSMYVSVANLVDTYTAGTGIDITDHTVSLTASGVTAGSYGPSADAKPAHSGTFSVPYVTVDAYGRVTSASTKTITLPASGNVDTKVKQNSSTSDSAIPLLLAYQASPTSGTSSTVNYSTGITANPSTGTVTATTFSGALSGKASTAGTADKLGTDAGSGTQPVYFSGGVPVATTYALNKTVPSDAVFTDTKNTAGSTDSSSKLFLVGATSQAANPQTYSQDTAYVGTDGCLYSGGSKVLTGNQTVTLSGDVTGSGTTAITTTLASSGVTAGSYGLSAAATPAYGATFNVPYITVDAKGRVTAATTNTVTIPASDNTDKKVLQSGSSTSKWRNILLGYNDTSESTTGVSAVTNQAYVTTGFSFQPSTNTLHLGNIQNTGNIYSNVSQSGTAGGIWLYGTDENGYGFALRQTESYSTHGSATGDWAVYNFCTGSNSGWIFRSQTDSTNVASISTTGNASFNGNLSLGGSGTTRPVVMQYNSTTQSIEFTFN